MLPTQYVLHFEDTPLFWSTGCHFSSPLCLPLMCTPMSFPIIALPLQFESLVCEPHHPSLATPTCRLSRLPRAGRRGWASVLSSVALFRVYVCVRVCVPLSVCLSLIEDARMDTAERLRVMVSIYAQAIVFSSCPLMCALFIFFSNLPTAPYPT